MLVCEKFVSRDQPLGQIDEKFLLYTNIVERMDTMQRFHDIGTIRLNLHTLIDGIRAYAVDWKNTLGEILIEKTLKTLKILQQHMSVRKCVYCARWMRVCEIGNLMQLDEKQCFRMLLQTITSKNTFLLF